MRKLAFTVILSSALCLFALAALGAVRPLDPDLSDYQYPFPVNFREIDTQGQRLRMAYMDVAPASSNGRTVVLLHGKNFSGAYWASTIVALSKEGYRVVVPDQIGFGKSSKPDAYQFTFQGLAANTRSILDSLRVREVTLVGHSMGGMLAIRMALMYPDRVERLALVNPIGLEDWKLVAPYRSVDETFAQELKATPESIQEYQKQNYFGGVWKPEYDRLTEILAGWTQHPDYRRVAWNAALTSDMIFTQPVVYEFERLTMPTLLIIGQRDRTALGKERVAPDVAARMGDYPSLGKAAAHRIPSARLIELQEAGHLPQVDAFDEYIHGLIEFLASHDD